MRNLLIGLLAVGSISAFAENSIRYSCNDNILTFDSGETSMVAFEISGTNKRIKLNQNGLQLIFTAEEVQNKSFNSRNIVSARAMDHDELEDENVTQLSSLTTRAGSEVIEFKVPTETGWHGVTCHKL